MEVQTKCTYDRATEAAEFIKSKVSFKPQMALILGSGLGDFADTLDGKVAIPYSDIPYFKKSTVQGHKGNLVFGKCKGVEVVAMQGRNHFYEGHKMEEIVFPIRVFKLIGITKIIVTNAAGGVNKMLEAGDLMLIKDHINYLGTNPLIGPNDERFGPRFPDMSDVYHKKFREIAAQTMKELKIPVKEGVYVAFTGPSYETPAEIQMAGRMGADAVGMSTVPEAIVANHMGIKVLGISCICNMAAGISLNPLSHKEVQEAADQVKTTFVSLLEKVIPKL